MTTSQSGHCSATLIQWVAFSALAAVGLVCTGVGHADAAPFAYVGNGGGRPVSVIDVETNTVIATVSLPYGSAPADVAVTPDGARVYVTSGNSPGIVSVIDTATNRVLVPEITVGFGASGVAVSPDGRFVYVASQFAGTVSVISTSTNTLVATIPAGFQPTDVAVTPDGSQVYVATAGTAVPVIDTASNTVVKSIAVGSNCHNVVISPDGSKVFVSCLNSRTVSVIASASNTVSATITVGSFPYGMAVTPDGARLYVVDHDPVLSNGSLAVIDTASNSLLTRVNFPPFHTLWRVAVTPDGARIYVTVNTPQRVLVVDTAANVVVGDPIPIQGIPQGIAMSPPPIAGHLPPLELHASSIVGNQVTLRWTPRTTTVKPTGYVLEGGTTPGEVLASIPTGSTTPSFTFIAPTGAYYVRIHSVAGTDKSAASNEIRVFINAPATPSPPANLLALVTGSTLALAWRNTYGGGAPSSLLLDVSGSAVGTLPLPLGDTFTLGGVPAGTYVLSLRAVNATGTSLSSNAVTVTVPDSCGIFPRIPEVPVNFLATVVGNVISLSWQSPDSGPAPTGFVLVVSGAINGQFPLQTRAVSAAVGSGSYTFSVYATNPCGAGSTTGVQQVVIP